MKSITTEKTITANETASRGLPDSRLSNLWAAFPPAGTVGGEIRLAKSKKENHASSQILYL
tara:strand:- start:512 stop:694 length:183 start_codon:yes stop_codon:yes gene_type:complete